LDYWVENDCMIDLKPNTVSNYKKKIENTLKPNLGRYKLKSITREVLQAFLTDMFNMGYAHTTLIVLKGLLSKSLNYAEDHHFIARSPAVRLKIPKHLKPKVKTRTSPHHLIPADAMEKIFARFPERTSQYIPLRLGYECGLRLGEVYGLCWEDIDFKNKVLYINRQVQWMEDRERGQLDKIENNGTSECGNGYWYFCPPKYNSYRTIELSNSLIALLMRERERQKRSKEYYAEYYTKYYADEALSFNGVEPENPVSVNRISSDDKGFPIHLLCSREDGTFITPRTMQHASRIIKRDIFSKFDFHSLRMTHASMLAEMDVEPKYIQTRLGHADMKTTLKVYVQVTDLMRTRGRDCINELYN
ncbi:MAG: site-specific integrase, partial [Ruminococcus flavefaciens]|nr:site-specific integrase [Ruminococcus flavefaciens]